MVVRKKLEVKNVVVNLELELRCCHLRLCLRDQQLGRKHQEVHSGILRTRVKVNDDVYDLGHLCLCFRTGKMKVVGRYGERGNGR